MEQTKYEANIPEFFREKVYEANIRRFQIEEYYERLNVEKAHLRTELSPAYIANLHILTDRNALLKELPAKATVAEIGAGNGDFSNNILLISDPKQLYLIDHRSEDGSSDDAMSVTANKFMKEVQDGQVFLDRGDVLSLLAEYDDGYFDWVYINSEPSYEATKSVLELCKMKVDPQGIISGSNYTTCNFVELVRFGVIEAVHEFCKKYRWEMIYLTHERHRNLSYALKHIDFRQR